MIDPISLDFEMISSLTKSWGMMSKLTYNTGLNTWGKGLKVNEGLFFIKTLLYRKIPLEWEALKYVMAEVPLEYCDVICDILYRKVSGFMNVLLGG